MGLSENAPWFCVNTLNPDGPPLTPTMFLSKFNSLYRADGSLEVDLRRKGGPPVRFGLFSDGMPWYRGHGDGWVETAFDWGARLVNRAHESQRDLPVLRYLNDWPPAVIAAVEPMWFAQACVLQVCARYPAAADLARSNPNLLWLVGDRYALDANWRERLPDLLGGSQRALLAAVLDQPRVREAQVRFLRKVLLMRGDRATLRRLRKAVRDEDAVMTLRHWRRLPSSLLEVVRGPLLPHLHWLREELVATDNPWVLGRILEPRLTLLRDTSRMLAGYARDRTDLLVARYAQDWAGVELVHEALLGMNEDQHVETDPDLDPELAFGPPPIPSSEEFQAISTVGELRREGRSMRHCVAVRARDILEGSCYVYRVNVAGERGTLQVGKRPDGVVIEEFRLARNADPSPAAWAAAREWIRTSGQGRLPASDEPERPT